MCAQQQLSPHRQAVELEWDDDALLTFVASSEVFRYLRNLHCQIVNKVSLMMKFNTVDVLQTQHT